jgi:hypothetical protein
MGRLTGTNPTHERSPRLGPSNLATLFSNAGAGGEQVRNVVTTGAFVSILPLIHSFPFQRRYSRGGLAIGSNT